MQSMTGNHGFCLGLHGKRISDHIRSGVGYCATGAHTCSQHTGPAGKLCDASIVCLSTTVAKLPG
jgi:hypothetical protein